MRRRLMSNLEVSLRRRFSPAGRRFAFRCPVCEERAYDEWQLTKEDQRIPILQVPSLPHTVGCPWCKTEMGTSVDTHSHQPGLAMCGASRTIGRICGTLVPTLVTERLVPLWRGSDQLWWQNQFLHRYRYGVDLAVKCTKCGREGWETVRPVKGVPTALYQPKEERKG